MKSMKKMLTLVSVLVFMLLASAVAEEIYIDKTERDTSLFNDLVCTYDNYFSMAFPDDWQFLELSAEDMANGVMEVAADDLSNPGMKVTIVKYTPAECEEIFGGSGYDAIYNAVCAAYDSVYSARINNVWTVAYKTIRDDHYLFVLDFTTSDYLMYQIRFDIFDENLIDMKNSMVYSLEGV